MKASRITKENGFNNYKCEDDHKKILFRVALPVGIKANFFFRFKLTIIRLKCSNTLIAEVILCADKFQKSY